MPRIVNRRAFVVIVVLAVVVDAVLFTATYNPIRLWIYALGLWSWRAAGLYPLLPYGLVVIGQLWLAVWLTSLPKSRSR